MKLLTSLLLLILPICSYAGVSGGGVGPRPMAFGPHMPDETLPSGVSGGGGGPKPMEITFGGESSLIKAISQDRGELVFSYKASLHAVPQIFRMRSEEFLAGEEKYLSAVRRSFQAQEWVGVEL